MRCEPLAHSLSFAGWGELRGAAADQVGLAVAPYALDAVGNVGETSFQVVFPDELAGGGSEVAEPGLALAHGLLHCAPLGDVSEHREHRSAAVAARDAGLAYQDPVPDATQRDATLVHHRIGAGEGGFVRVPDLARLFRRDQPGIVFPKEVLGRAADNAAERVI